MGSHGKVSIILVNYNAYRDTMDCLRSLRKITYPDYQLIIVDNASTDESVKKLREFLKEEEILISSKTNGGFSAGNNTGIRYALKHGADYCLLLNNDTVVEEDFLDKLMEGFSLFRNCGLTIGKILYESKRNMVWYAGGSISKTTAKTEHWNYRKKDKGVSDSPQKVSFATGCCMCLARKTIEAVGLMDESYFLYEEDVDYCCRISRAGFDMVYIPQARIYHKVSASTGRVSGLSQYYTIRNKYRLITLHYHGFNKVAALLFVTVQNLVRSVKGKVDFRIYRRALRAFLKGETGKVESLS